MPFFQIAIFYGKRCFSNHTGRKALMLSFLSIDTLLVVIFLSSRNFMKTETGFKEKKSYFCAT